LGVVLTGAETFNEGIFGLGFAGPAGTGTGAVGGAVVVVVIGADVAVGAAVVGLDVAFPAQGGAELFAAGAAFEAGAGAGVPFAAAAAAAAALFC